MHEMTNNDNRASMPGYVSCTGNLVRKKLLSNAKKVFYKIAMKMNRQILSLGESLVYVHLEKFVYSGQYRFIAEVSEIEALYFLVNSN